MSLVTIINLLLPIICDKYQEGKLIGQLNNHFNFDHNIFLLNASADVDRYVNPRCNEEFPPQSLYEVSKNTDHITELESLTNVTGTNPFMIIVPESSKLADNLNLLTRVKNIQRLRLNMKFGVFFKQTASTKDVRELFEWSWTNRITNIFVVTHPLSEAKMFNPERLLSIFTFNPFGLFDVIDVAGEPFDKFFLSQNTNFQQYPLLRNKIPNNAYTKKFWMSILHVMNFSFEELQHNDTALSKDLFKAGIDIHTELMTQFYSDDNQMTLYPMEVLIVGLVVPEALPYTEFAAYLQTITSDKFYGYSLATIAIAVLLLTWIRFIKQKKFLFFESVADVLNLLMNDDGSIKYQKLSQIELFLIVPLTFMGLVIVNGILSNLQSYLTQPVLQPQMKTIEDIHRSPFPIIAWSKYYKNEIISVLQQSSKHEDWKDRVHALEEEVHNQQVTTYNTSACYLLGLDSMPVLLKVQKRLNIKGYYATHISINKFLYSFRVRAEFPFIDRINEIAGWIQSAGLYDVWLREHDTRIEKALLRDNRDLPTETNIETFPMPMFIVYGWSASVIIFLVEILSKNIKLMNFAKDVAAKLSKKRRKNQKLKSTKKRTAGHTKETDHKLNVKMDDVKALKRERNITKPCIRIVNEVIMNGDQVWKFKTGRFIVGPTYGTLLREYKQMNSKNQGTRIAQQRLNILAE